MNENGSGHFMSIALCPISAPVTLTLIFSIQPKLWHRIVVRIKWEDLVLIKMWLGDKERLGGLKKIFNNMIYAIHSC